MLPFLRSARQYLAQVILTLEEQVAALNPSAWFDATETYAKSKIAVDFNGSSSYLSLNDDAYKGSDQDFSVFIVFKTGASLPAISTLATVWEEATNDRSWVIRLATSNVRFQIDSLGTGSSGLTQQTTSTATLAINTVYMMACTYNSTTDTMRVNVFDSGGSELIDETTSHANGAYAGTNQFTVGAFVIGGTPAHYFNGDIDQISYFSGYCFTDQDITDLVNSGAGLNHKDLDGTETFYNNIVAWYDFNTPTIFGRNYTEDRRAVNLNADKFIYPIANFNTLVNSKSWGFNIWIKFIAGGGNEAVFGVVDSGGNDSCQFWVIDDSGADDGKLYFRIADGTNDVICKTTTSVLNISSDNDWHMLTVLVHNDTVSMYLDGSSQTLDTTDISSVNQSGISYSNDLWLTQRSGSFGNLDANAHVDQIQFFSSGDIASLITTLYNSGTPINYEDIAYSKTNLQNHYDINEQATANIGQDSHGSVDLGQSFASQLIVPGVNSLDLNLTSISSSNVATGHVEGKAAGYDGLTLVTDRSTNGNNFEQTTITQVGTWIDEAYMQFTGDNNLDTQSNIDLSSDFTIVMRVRHSDVTESCDLIATSTTIWNNSVAGKDVVLGVTATNALTNDTWHTVSVKSEGGTISFRLDETANGSGSRDATVVTASTLQLSDVTMTQVFDVRGFLVIESALSDANIDVVDQYFQTLDPA